MSNNYIILENGETVEFFSEKNKQIEEKLSNSSIKTFKNEEKLDRRGMKRFGFRLLMQIEDELGKYDRMDVDTFLQLTADDIEFMWWRFHSLMAYFNNFFEIVPNRQTFMLYCGINSRQYKQLMDSQDEEIRSVMAYIEDRLVGKGFSAGENGNVNSSAIMSRLKSVEVGHNVVTASEEKIINAVAQKTPLELERQMNQLLGGDTKLLK